MQPLGADDPSEIGPYRLLRRLGAGGMGRVYLARSQSGRTVAVKVVHPHFAVDEQFRSRFRREVASARRVAEAAGEDEWTAPVLDADPDAMVPWVATGYVAGPPLHNAVDKEGPLPEDTVRTMGARLARALHQVHGLNLVHRDVKPSNVLLTLDGPRLIDFGIARATDGTASLTATGASIGSPGYMSPEQVLGRTVLGASDVFSLGAVLAYAARGEPPFPGDSSATLLYRVVHEEPELDGLEGELHEIVTACLDKEADRRPEPGELADRLAGETGGGVGPVPGGWLPAPLVEQASRHAVALLNLELPDRGGPSTASGPVAFTHSAEGPAVGAAAGSAPGAVAPGFGPPDPAYVMRPESGPQPMAAGAPPTPAPYAPVPPRWPETKAERKRAEKNQRPKKRKRGRIGCLVLLAVFGAIVLPGGASLFSVLPGWGSGGGGKPPGDSVGDQVPESFLGTWKGKVTTRSGAPGGELTVTFKQGEYGETVGTGRVELRGLVCDGEWKLVTSEKTKLITRDQADNEDKPLCSASSDPEHFALRGGELHYSSMDEAAGTPEGTLTKAR
ncbi:serine/threonine-protein kinase [Streptomyces sulphureus]|uniref:serine/threonine-protein kinase n=1 Tax=Streptomyces sulphureus TaxID=47758 RepID=UPI0003788481|nr:serine/threonine-protein kinase [Streptomyces sulphureus]